MPYSFFRTPAVAIECAVLLLALSPPAVSQTVEIVNDNGVVVSGLQTVNVGEHVRLGVRVSPAGTVFSSPSWIVQGTHLKDWITKDAQPMPMAIGDYTAETIHFLWKDVTSALAPNLVRVTVVVAGTPHSAEIPFQVVRADKAEKFYSDDLLMEAHNNWHSVYMFYAASTRRGDLFLAWHRSQLDFFNQWRAYFGYPPTPYWNPTTSWVSGAPPPARQHPSTAPVPAPGFSQRHDIITLDLTDQGLAHTTEGEYDLVTQALGRGTTSEFVAASYVLRTETVHAVGSLPNTPNYSRVGIATNPTWWAPNTGQVAQDPWFAAGCPARSIPTNPAIVSTCSVAAKRSFSDYTLRELGESIESGWYATDFRVNYHALGHIAASDDMSNPVTSMRDPIFWGWHRSIDSTLALWQGTRGAEARPPLSIYGAPTFSAGWNEVRVAFSHRVVPDFVVPGHVTVNGSPATAVTDVSLTGKGYIFAFSGFAVPPAGPVEVVVRREINNTVRTSIADPRPAPTLIFSTYGNILTPAVNRYTFTKP